MRFLPPTPALYGTPPLPGDKSISHRVLLLAALAQGSSTLRGLAPGEDVATTLACLRALGVRIDAGAQHHTVVVHGTGPRGLRPPQAPLNCGNSGTTMRLLMGLLAGLGIAAHLHGDASLSARPMRRIADPLRAMGARIDLAPGGSAPVVLHGGGPLTGVPHVLAMASGQLKGALLLAGLFAQGPTTLTGALGGRDHTETLLRAAGAHIESEPGRVTLRPGAPLSPFAGAGLRVPGDMSAASFWLAASQVVARSQLRLHHVGLNPSRTGLVQALRRMGAPIMRHVPVMTDPQGAISGEPVGDLTARRALTLHAITLAGQAIAPLIDELPLLIGMATLAQGVTVIRDAGELRVKETDRIAAMVVNLRRMGARIEERADGVRVVGPQKLHGARLDSFGDHRVAMASSVMAMATPTGCTLRGAGCVAVSDPSFFDTWDALRGAPEGSTAPGYLA